MKNSKKGISLIVLIITIIVIIILATAILVSVISNNPISEANKARYESDRDNMQAVFTNTVGKIMAENQGVVNVTAGQINTETADVNETTGEVAYTVDNATIAANGSGTIKFDKGTNDATTYYTGKKLPIYAAGETKWYVDSEGVLSLEVAGVKYGNGVVEGGVTEEPVALAAGLYDEDGNMTMSWQEILTYEQECDGGWYFYDGKITSDFTMTGSGSEIFVGKLVIDDSVTTIGWCSFAYTDLTEIVLPNTIKTIETQAFDSMKISSIEIPSSVTSVGNYVFWNCSNLQTVVVDDNNLIYDSRDNCNAIIETSTNTLINACNTTTIPNTVTKIGAYAFSTTEITSIEIPNGVVSIESNAFQACSNLRTINYNGTKTEWNNITLGERWNEYCPEITVHCTDGDIIIPAWTE